MIHLQKQRTQIQHKSHEPKLSKLLHHEQDILKDLDVSGKPFVSSWPLSAAGYTSSSLTAPALFFMTNSLQRHQSLMTK